MISRVKQITESLSQQIENGDLSTGTRLLSIRDAADRYGVSKNTIVEVYDRLVASGYLDPRRGSGFYVALLQRSSAVAPSEHFTEAVDSVSLLREQLNQNYTVRAGDGRAPSSWMETSELGQFSGRSGGGAEARGEFEYGAPQGFTPLRETIARTLRERSINSGPDQVLLTVGANHALDLIIRHFVSAGDEVLVETPGYYPLFGKLRLQNAQMTGVVHGTFGPDLEDLEHKAKRHQARLFFVQPMAHNPKGTSMELSTMHRLLNIAERHNLIIVEDDPFADILPRATPHLAALDGLDRVIYIGTFSKTLSASLRSGYIAASRKIIDSLTDIKMLTLVNSSSTIERIIHTIIMRGRYRKHLLRLRNRVTKASAEAYNNLESIGIKGMQPATGGYYIWCPLPENLNDMEITRLAAAEGIFLAPGSLFRLDGSNQQPALRLNIAHASNRKLLAFLEQQIRH